MEPVKKNKSIKICGEEILDVNLMFNKKVEEITPDKKRVAKNLSELVMKPLEHNTLDVLKFQSNILRSS